jgi:thiol-disulfide isomerase/thioredoxin
MLAAVLTLAHLTLAAVFATAALAKVIDRPGTRSSLEAFGVPGRGVGPLALALPIAELTVAAALVHPHSARWGATGGLALLTAFTAAIAASMVRGRAPECHCFGRLHSEPAGASTLVRNAALAALSLAVITMAPATGGTEIPEAVVIFAVFAVGGAWLVGRRARRQQIAASPDAWQIGPAVASVPMAQLEGGVVSLDELLARELPVVLVFTQSGCGACERLMPRVLDWQREFADKLTIAVVSDPLALKHYGVSGTPAAVLVPVDGPIVSRPVAGEDRIEQLVAAACGIEDAGGGEPVMDLELRGLDGRRVRLGARRRETLVVFWDPGCDYCADAADGLRRLARRTELVLVSRGSVEANRELGVRAEIGLDDHGAVARALGAPGTPSAVLIGGDGRLASSVAAGMPAVRMLADRAPRSSTGRLERLMSAPVTRRRGFGLAAIGAAAAGGLVRVRSAGLAAGARVCDPTGLERCTSAAVMRSRVGEALCRFERRARRARCRANTSASRARHVTDCRLAHCSCPSGTSPCAAPGTEGICCGPGETCQIDALMQPRCVTAANTPDSQPVEPIPQHPLLDCPPTVESLEAAAAALRAGASEVALSPCGDLRLLWTREGANVVAERITLRGKTILSVDHGPAESAAWFDVDVDDFREWRAKLVRGVNPQETVTVERFDPRTRRLVIRDTYTRSDEAVHVLREEDDGSGGLLRAEWDTSIWEEQGGVASCKQTVTPMPCDPAEEALYQQRLRECVTKGTKCLADHNAPEELLRLAYTYVKGLHVGVKFSCDHTMCGSRSGDSCCPIAVTQGWYLTDTFGFETSQMHIVINPLRFDFVLDPSLEAGIICHELSHFGLGPHSKADNGLSSTKLAEVDRVYACQTMCFGLGDVPQANKCVCATCLGTNRCDSRCGQYGDCNEPPARCYCPCQYQTYNTYTECTVRCPSGLCCFSWMCRKIAREC